MKSGLEIHQQLDTHKLFCNCPSVLRNDKPEFEVNRKLHAVAGEAGEIDIAAKFEAEKEKEFTYQGYDTTCLVELDEEPPHLINQEALQIAIHIALLLNCKILSIVQVMRKTVVDGSNTSGFQRTALIARNGYIKTSQGKISIENIYLEEDSARNSGKKDNKIIWRLDRLGVPLVEIQTGPDIKSPEQAKEAALLIGDILRSCKVKRGIGTIRQDINISIPKHPRIEIKGFQDPKVMIKTVENELKRQEKNIKSGKPLSSEVRNALPDATTEFLRPMPGAARMYPETDLPLLKISRNIINNAKKTLPKLRSEIRKELEKTGLSEEMTKILLKENKLEDFKSLLKIINDPKFIYQALIELPKELSRHENKNLSNILTLDIIESIIRAVKQKNIEKSDVKHVMQEVIKGKTLEQALEIEKIDLTKVEQEIIKLLKEKPDLNMGGYMGLVMNKFKGQVIGKQVSEILNRLLKQ